MNPITTGFLTAGDLNNGRFITLVLEKPSDGYCAIDINISSDNGETWTNFASTRFQYTDNTDTTQASYGILVPEGTTNYIIETRELSGNWYLTSCEIS